MPKKERNTDPSRFGVIPDPERLASVFLQFCEVVAKLRSPEGCPWDRQQTLDTIKPYTLEETYELLDAIDTDDDEAIAEELGDLLLQVVLDAQIAQDEDRFGFVSVIEQITAKMINRHPHVFADAEAETPDDVRRHWDQSKQQEKQRDSIFDGIPHKLPALARTYRVTSKAARVGFDFPHRAMLFDKLREETEELAQELFDDGRIPDMAATVEADPTPDRSIDDPEQKSRVEGEIGDLLFVVANIARRWQINPEQALRKSNQKFERRFRYIETTLHRQGKDIHEVTLREMEEIYQQCKRSESRD